MRFNVKGLEDIKKWIYRWLPYVEVVKPAELRTAIKSDLRSAGDKHKS